MNWQRFLKGELRRKEDLAKHTSFNIGGPVEFWAEPKDLLDLRKLVLFVRKESIPLWIIGAGSNLIVDDRGIKGIVVKLNSPYFRRITFIYPASLNKRRLRAGKNQQVISVGSGVKLANLIRFTQKNNLSGSELLSGIPGTVGGALVMNTQDIGNRVLDVTVMDRQGRVKTIKRKDVQFNYRSSNLDRYIVLSARFKLIKKSKRAIKKKITEYLKYRRKTQDLSFPSCGCFFKNPDSKSVLRLRSVLRLDSGLSPERSRMDSGLMVSPSTSSGCLEGCRVRSRHRVEPSAAYLIERCGLKGYSIGGAAVSSKHANFILNKGGASFSDILRLKRYITTSVKKKFNIDLKPEIKIWKRI
jgi:UDP-N-acetylmuramate dehydrogenase